MGDFIQLIVSGTATGAIYALAALGFTLLWQAAGVINFAQGEFVMLPAFAMLFCIAVGAPLWLALLLTCACCRWSCWATASSAVIVDPLLKHRRDADRGRHHSGCRSRCATACARATAPRRIRFRAPVRRPAVQRRGRQRLATPTSARSCVAGAIVFGLQAFLHKTVTGRAMQAVAQNTDSATVLGINVPRMVFYIFAINAVLACRRGAAGHADLPRQVRHGRARWAQGVLRRHHRRLQQTRAARCWAAC